MTGVSSTLLHGSAPAAAMFVFACGTNNRYSIAWWEEVFFETALRVVADPERIHFAYANFDGGVPQVRASHTVHFDARSTDRSHLAAVEAYVRQHAVQLVFGFDFTVRRKAYPVLRHAGVQRIVSYFGAPMSGPYHGLRLLLRKLDVAIRGRYQPDRYVFQAHAMARTAEYRGIPRDRISVVRSGVDESRYVRPDSLGAFAHEEFGIPRERRVVLYAGHLSERKGLRVIMNAAKDLTHTRGRKDVHFLLLGEKSAEAEYRPMLAGTDANAHVTFGGYRNDMPRILQSTFVGLRPSTGWDSFPVSCMEMTAAGVPLITSDQGGLPEMVDDGRTGCVVPAGDHVALANAIAALLDDPAMRDRWSVASRERILSGYTRQQFVERLSGVIYDVWRRPGRR